MSISYLGAVILGCVIGILTGLIPGITTIETFLLGVGICVLIEVLKK